MIREFNNISLKGRNSFHVDVAAKRLIEFETTEDLQKIFSSPIGEWMVLSGGNNILFTKDYEGTLLSPTATAITPLRVEGEVHHFKVEGGLEWDDLVAWAAEQGLWGIENLSLIPGKAGAAPIQNIGAYGCEACDVITAVEFFSLEELSTLRLAAEECHFGYRESIFKHELKGKVIVTAIEIALSTRPAPKLGYGDLEREVEQRGGATLHNIRQAVCAIRRSKLPEPDEIGNAGSFFKNPIVNHELAADLKAQYSDMPIYPIAGSSMVKLAAGWLIDRAGMKGYRCGAVGVHDRQALVLVNHGGATGDEVLSLARMVQAKVKEHFGVEIDTEVNIL